MKHKKREKINYDRIRDEIIKTNPKGLDEKDILALHLDHGDIQSVMACINEGFSSVMIDASSLSDLENIALTREVVKVAHKKKCFC